MNISVMSGFFPSAGTGKRTAGGRVSAAREKCVTGNAGVFENPGGKLLIGGRAGSVKTEFFPVKNNKGKDGIVHLNTLKHIHGQMMFGTPEVDFCKGLGTGSGNKSRKKAEVSGGKIVGKCGNGKKNIETVTFKQNGNTAAGIRIRACGAGVQTAVR
jgi:hypothetical protein